MRLFTFVPIVSLAALAFAASPQATGPTAACDSGSASGSWNLPHTNQDGTIDGVLFAIPSTSPTPTPVFKIHGGLIDVPGPCLSCVQGKILAYLDDGIGPAPDYFVEGKYTGSFFSGTGTFDAVIRKAGPTLTSIAPVGRISGTFKDPPGPTSTTNVGTFQGKWKLCD